jgi:hypothetical protein
METYMELPNDLTDEEMRDYITDSMIIEGRKR